ncbi:MAG: class I SAM-dependent methyltransferase [Acidobacteriia bacterium]|nr:class I SAM-dependent methyltransferase [Terriglobia bacterium]
MILSASAVQKKGTFRPCRSIILSKKFLTNGNTVYGVEPNDEMRAAAERLLEDHAHFTSVRGAAEATGPPAGAIDLVVAGQAFHWFHQEEARAEFARILKPRGWVALVWNTRKTETTSFSREYERLLQTFTSALSHPPRCRKCCHSRRRPHWRRS